MALLAGPLCESVYPMAGGCALDSSEQNWTLAFHPLLKDLRCHSIGGIDFRFS